MIGQKLGSFLIESELGAGAMGIVYKGVRETGKTRVAAVKVIGTDQMAKGKAFERFIREAEILEQFRHPNIVRYLARGKTGKTFYYAMEFVEGRTLDRILEESGALPWQEVVAFGVQLCDALQYAHDHGVVHRDLKPSNLMITAEGRLKLTDFGIAKDLDATALTATGRTLGTAAYMAPEQIRGTPEISHKTDLYALGILFYQMLVGDLPFHGSSAIVLMHCHMNEVPPKPSDKTAVIPAALDETVVKLMAKAPSDRPWDAAAVGMVLRDLQEKAAAKQAIPMVWPEEGSAEANPTRTMDAPRPKSKSTGKKKKRARGLTRLREVAPTVGLVVALFVLAGGIGYVVYPPSAKYLYGKAEPLMASEERTDWLMAESNFLDDLDRRFPDHPYKVQTDAWRDKIALSSARRRAVVIETSSIAGFRKAEGLGEGLFAATFPEAKAATERHDDIDAARRWATMADKIEADGTHAERGWLLLARERSAAIEAAVKARAATVEDYLSRANDAEARGLPDQALAIRRDLVKRFGMYVDLADALAPVKAHLAEVDARAAPEPPR